MTMFLTKLKLGTSAVVCAGLSAALIGSLFTSWTSAQDEKSKVQVKKDKVLKLDEPVNSMRWAPDADVMASLSNREKEVDGKKTTLTTFRVWDAKTGKLKLNLGELEYRGLHAFDLSPDGKVLAISQRGPMTVGDKVELFDTENGTLLQTIEMEYARSRVWFSFAPDGNRLAVCGSDIKGDRLHGTLRLFDTKTGKRMKKLVSDGDGLIVTVAYSADGKLIAGGSSNGEITVWETATGKVLKALKQAGAIGAIAFSPDGKQIACSSHESQVTIWDIGAAKARPLKGEATTHVNAVLFSPDGRYVAAHRYHAARIDEKDTQWKKHGVHVWDAHTGVLIHEWFTLADGIAFTRDSKCLVILHDQKTIKYMEITSSR
jgi:WD40 repeat protein